jgi:5-methylthioadenosine/S-adenosylhomocysteine deaminase
VALSAAGQSLPTEVATAPQTADLVVSAGTVLTMDRSRSVLIDGALAIADGVIAAVGPREEIVDGFRGREVLEFPHGIAHPGLVDAHVHAFQHLGRSSLPDSMPLEREHDQWTAYVNALDEETIEAATLLACMEMVLNGTTAFADMGGDPFVTARAIEVVGLRGLVSATVWDDHRIEGLAPKSAEDSLADLERCLSRFPPRSGRLVAGCAGLAGMGRVTEPLLVEARALARDRGAQTCMHLAFAADDTARVVEQAGGRGPVEYLADLDFLGPDLSLVHMIQLGDPDVAVLADSATRVVHCPGAAARVGLGAGTSGRFPEMLERGVSVGLGSDAGNFSDALDVMRQAYLTTVLHREARRDQHAITAEAAFEMATLGGARALGLEDEIGSLEPGKRADVVVHDGDRPELHPMWDAVTNLLYSSQSRSVDTVLVDGVQVVRGGELQTVDHRRELARIDETARRLAARLAYRVPRRWPVTGA